MVRYSRIFKIESFEKGEKRSAARGAVLQMATINRNTLQTFNRLILSLLACWGRALASGGRIVSSMYWGLPVMTAIGLPGCVASLSLPKIDLQRQPRSTDDCAGFNRGSIALVTDLCVFLADRKRYPGRHSASSRANCVAWHDPRIDGLNGLRSKFIIG